MLEYALFHTETCDRFCEFLRQRELEPQIEQQAINLNVLLPEGLPEDLMDEIEAYYDELLVMTEALVQDESSQHGAGVAVSLADGRRVLAAVPPDLINKVLAVLTFDEIAQLVSAVVEAVEHPDERPLCQHYGSIRQ
jgi:hypothetical protein